MGTTAISGPQVVYGPTATENNPPVPSSFAWGETFFDARTQYAPGSSSNPQAFGFPQEGLIQTINAYAYTTTSVVSTAVTAGVPAPFLTTPSPGMTPGQNVYNRSSGKVISNASILDDFNLNDYYGTPVATCYLQKGNMAIWDPSTMVSRILAVNGGVTPNTFTIKGLDVYGYQIEEVVQTTGITPVNTNKAYKALISVTSLVNGHVSISTWNQTGFPLRYDYPGTAFGYENGTLESNLVAYNSSLYTVTNIVPSLGILTISISGTFVLPVGSSITISDCDPVTYNGTYTVLTSSAGTLTVASTNTDTYNSGGFIFCDQSGIATSDVRGTYLINTDPSRLVMYQSISMRNMLSNVGQFGVPQFGG